MSLEKQLGGVVAGISFLFPPSPALRTIDASLVALVNIRYRCGTYRHHNHKNDPAVVRNIVRDHVSTC